MAIQLGYIFIIMISLFYDPYFKTYDQDTNCMKMYMDASIKVWTLVSKETINCLCQPTTIWHFDKICQRLYIYKLNQIIL